MEVVGVPLSVNGLRVMDWLMLVGWLCCQETFRWLVTRQTKRTIVNYHQTLSAIINHHIFTHSPSNKFLYCTTIYPFIIINHQSLTIRKHHETPSVLRIMKSNTPAVPRPSKLLRCAGNGRSSSSSPRCPVQPCVSQWCWDDPRPTVYSG